MNEKDIPEMKPNRPYWDAVLYQNSSTFQFKLGMMALQRLNPQDGERILDLGCGNALLSIELAKVIPTGQVIAIDSSEAMFLQAKKNIRIYNVKNVHVMQLEALALPFQNEFDAVFSNSVIHWIHEVDLLYTKINRALKENGRILIQTAYFTENPFFRALQQIPNLAQFRQYFTDFQWPWKFLTPEETRDLLKKCNFRRIRVDPFQSQMQFESEETFLDFAKAAALLPYLQQIPPQQHPVLIQQFKELYKKENHQTISNIYIDRIFISAEK